MRGSGKGEVFKKRVYLCGHYCLFPVNCVQVNTQWVVIFLQHNSPRVTIIVIVVIIIVIVIIVIVIIVIVVVIFEIAQLQVNRGALLLGGACVA